MAGQSAIEAGTMRWESRTGGAPGDGGRRALRVLIAIVGCCLIGAAVGVLIGFFMFVRSLERYERDPAAQADAIVVLTGGAQRIGDAIDLLAKGYAKRLLITGVNERTSREEIERLNPGQRRLFDCCVDLDYRARNTIGNAIETRRWMNEHGFTSMIVVTSNYHMPRTLTELDHALPDARKLPYPVVTGSVVPEGWWRKPRTFRLLAAEYVKFVLVLLRIRLERDPERSSVAVLVSPGGPVRAMASPLDTR
jgi:uncharacterized SAM-binding protein YcdF (DUF218 family)